MKHSYKKSKTAQERSTKDLIKAIKKISPKDSQTSVEFIRAVGLGKPARNTSKT